MKTTRRHFLASTAVSAGAATLLTPSTARVHAAENNMIKVGLVGCGGRGRGAIVNVLDADPNCQLVAVGDAFRVMGEKTVEGLKAVYGDRIAVAPDAIYDGLECYKQVIPQCDVVLLCEPPAFRPFSLRAAVEAGKQVFCEKPVACDAEGVKSVMESARIAKEKKLNLVSGLCWRYDPKFGDMIKRIHDGVAGEVSSVRITYLTGILWNRPKVENDTEMMFQVRNWYNFTWLSGDFNVEQHVHSLDKAQWVLNDITPIAAYGLGGRMARTAQPAYGNIYDSMAVVYEYPNGKTVYSYCRQQNNCFNETDAYVFGSKGHANLWGNPSVADYQGNLIYRPEKKEGNVWNEVNNSRFLEQVALFKAIRSGGSIYINNGDYMCKSTMLGILGRLACYSGKRVTWEDAMNSPSIRPTGFAWTDNPPTLPDENGRYKIEVPGMGEVWHTVTR